MVSDARNLFEVAPLDIHAVVARLDGGATPDRASPHSYVFSTADITSDNVAAFSEWATTTSRLVRRTTLGVTAAEMTRATV